MVTTCVSNMKGGVGKTASAFALACGLYNAGKRVLIVDADPQGNVTHNAGIDVLQVDYTLLDVFNGTVSARDAIQVVKLGGLDLITAGLEMITADRRFSQFNDVMLLKKTLETVKNDYDYCVIDTSPFLGMLTTSALIASQYCIIPCLADVYSVMGAEQLQAVIENVREYLNPTLKILGLLITMYNPRTVLSRSIEDELQKLAESLDTKIYGTRIRKSQAIPDSQAMQTSLFEGTGHARTDYQSFIDEFMADVEGSR